MDALERLQDALNEEDPALAAEAIRLGADVNAMWEETVLLTTAVQLATADIPKLLLEAGADPNRKNLDGTTPLTWCRNAELVGLLLDAGASARHELHRPLFHSSMHAAAEDGDLVRLRLLLERGEGSCLLPEFFQMLAWTPLHCAVHEGHRDAARLLIEAGSDPNRFDDDLGYTAITLAAENDDVEMVRLLLDLGADPALQIGLNSSALDVARRSEAVPELLASIEGALVERARVAAAQPIATRFLVRGRVQGVGFRAFVLRAARREGLAGWVRNLPNGSVECMARRSSDALDRFRVQLRQGSPGSRVVRVEESEAAGQVLPEIFEIR